MSNHRYDLTRMIADLRANHLVNAPGTEQELRQLELRLGVQLDTELREFYSATNGATILGKEEWRYRILKLEEVERVRKLILGEDREEAGPAGWYAICDVHDGNYVAAEFDERNGEVLRLLDCYHETFPLQCKAVAGSFSEFLFRALNGGDCLYWLPGITNCPC